MELVDILDLKSGGQKPCGFESRPEHQGRLFKWIVRVMNLRIVQRNIVGAFIFSDDGKLLLGKTIKGGVYAGCWVVPGGGMEPGETETTALIREVKEEIGIDIDDAKIEQIEGVLTGQSEKVLRETSEKVLVDMSFYNFKVTLQEKASAVKLVHEDDFIDARWFAPEEVGSLKLSPPGIVILQKLSLL